MPHGRDALTWLDSQAETSVWFDRVDRFRVGDIEFHCSFQRGSRADQFFIRKQRRMVEEYVDVLDGFPQANLVELGIAEGGSVALAALVTPPRKLVALEIDETRVHALDELIGRLGLTERVRPYYGVDQSDRTRLRAIIDDEFAGEPLDLVIDDASHRLEETRASFETLLPRLRPGGLFLIEDWNWQHLCSRGLAKSLADPDSPARAEFERRLREAETGAPARTGSACGRPASTSDSPDAPPATLTTLTIELVLAQAESDEFLSEVTVDPHWVTVRRGSGHLDPLTFRLSDLFTDYHGVLPG